MTLPIKNWWNKKIIVLGDLIADVYVTGSISRMSREAPIPIVVEQERNIVLGGAGNVVANIKALGGVPIPVGIVGRDTYGDSILNQLKNRAFIQRADMWQTTTKTRIISKGSNSKQQLFRLDVHNSSTYDHTEQTISNLYAAMEQASALIISDYREGTINNEIIREVNKIALRGYPVFVDSPRFNEFHRAILLKPNEQELMHYDKPAKETFNEVGTYFVGSTDCKNLLVTRGSVGMVLFRREVIPVNVPAHGTNELTDVTGAGDTVIATFTLATLGGFDPVDAMKIANVAGGLKVKKFGTAIVDFSELYEELNGDEYGLE